MTKHKEIYVTPSHTKKVFANMKREGKGFSRKVTPLFEIMMVQAQEEDEGIEMPTVPQHTSTINQPSSSQTLKKQKLRKTKKQNTEVGRTAIIESSKDKGLGDQEDASKQGRKIADLDADAEEFEVEKVVSTAEVTTINATPTTVDELTLAQTLIEIKAAKPKVVTTAATTTKTVVTRPKARGVVVQELNSFVPIDTEVVKGSKSQAKGTKVDDEAKMKKLMEIVPDDEVAIDAIPLATKSPIIIYWKIIKEGKMGYFQIIRADGSSRRPEDSYEKVLWGDLKLMFEPYVESEVWRNLQGYNVTVWKLFSSSGVHFVRFQNLHIFMLVEKKYPLIPVTITKMLNKKLQTDQWNEMCYQLLKLMTKQRKNPGSI
ncbi:hypothetical protein Tco_1108925 [Tanacetum coccineum]